MTVVCKGCSTWLLATAVLLCAGSQILHRVAASENQHYLPSLQCYDPYGRPQRCIPAFENAAFLVPMEATNTCGEEDDEQTFCVQTGFSNRKSCDKCYQGSHSSSHLTDLHDPNNQTWWQSETMYEGIQYPSQVNLTLNLGKSFDITYIRVVFYAPRPESFAIYKRSSQNGPWTPYQYYSATCRETYSLPDFLSVKKGEDESRALCTSEYSDISPLRDGNVAFSSLEGRPSAISFDHSVELQNWVTATDIRIVLDRLNTFGDEVFGDTSVLQSYFYAIADVAVGARCKCNGHASDCVVSSGINGERTRVCDCKHNTDGPDCEKCLPLFNDAPWGRATSKNVHECKPCNCNGHSNKCFFDRHLYNQTGHGGHCLDCQRNRDGPNCERCKENFVMRSDGYCINCDCNPVGSRSLQCNAEGKCHCKPGVTGEKCDQCEDNYFNFGSKGCTPCECDARGSLDNKPNCHPETGVCVCKDNVEGRRCKECKPGFFNLDLDNRFGCTPCFCYGHTSECQSAMGYTQGSTTSNFNKQNERWTVVDEHNRPADVKYNKYSKNIGITAQGHQQLYFSAPDRFLGDQRASYNRQLKFRLQLIDQSRPSPAVDVILEGAGTRISLPIFAQHNAIPDQEFREYKFQLHESSDYYWQPSQSSRGFMSILTNLTAIKIRGTFATTGEAVLDDVELQTAYRGSAGRPASWIEQCTCPPGYLGQFCESCAPGFRHSPARGGPFMTCIPCDCNKHADICDSDTGRCICKHNTTGDTCDQCAKGYYGNALVGSEYDCKRCPCMENGACLQMGEEVICLECPVGYFGPRCEQCADGYFGNPNGQPVQLCQACDCNGNVDLNAVGNCNRTTGECLKCIHNTAGPRCDQCLPGHYGDPLSLPHGNCEACSCYPQGTEQTEDGVSICEQLSGSCRCKPNVVGRNCNECQAGFFNINSGNGCESCGCDPIGSYNATCERFSGQCYCKPGVTGLRCDQCEQYQYGFSTDGCKQCDCDESGSKGFQCDEYGQCPCNDNVEGRRCDRCKENKYDRHSGCVDCPHCYNLVQDAADEHREKLHNLSAVLAEIASKPTVIDDAEFDSKLRVVQEKINILTEDAKSGAGGEDRTLVERLNDLRHRLTAVRDELQKSDAQQHSAGAEIERANEHVSRAEEANVAVRRLLDTALELLQTDGIGALAKAKDRSDQFGSQSDQISHISRESRNIIADLEQQSSEKKENAKEAQEKSVQAYELAKNTFALQANISAELRSTIRSEIALAKDNLETTKRATSQALDEATAVYDKALTLLTSVNTIAVPQINIEKLKKDAILAGEYAERLRNQTVKLEQDHDALLTNYDDSAILANTLIERSKEQESDAVGLLEHVKEIHRAAVEAVALGDNTLAEAKKTYETLSGFQAQVAQSSQNAQTALDTVPAIDDQIQQAVETVDAATDALEGASQNAEAAKVNAEAAQKKFAEQASKDAETIRGEANQTKSAAQKLHSEADHLSGRVQMTDARIEKIAKQAEKDDILAREASEKVNQAKTDSADAKRQAERASKEVDAIVEELNRLKDINLVDLDALEKRLKDAEDKVAAARLSKRMESLVDNRNQQNSFVREHQHTIGLLKLEVDNIRQISESLPAGCYKRTRLEV